jgi:hypothetical protein
MFDYFSSYAAQFGVSTIVIILMIIWEAIWTAIAMWRAAKNNHMIWFVVFFIVNLLAIPEIVYLIVTRKKRR